MCSRQGCPEEPEYLDGDEWLCRDCADERERELEAAEDAAADFASLLTTEPQQEGV